MDEERSPLQRMFWMAVIFIALGSGAWWVLQRPPPKSAPPTVPAPEQPVAQSPAPVAAQPHYPIEAVAATEPTTADVPLPAVFDADPFVRDALSPLFGEIDWTAWLVADQWVARFVAFVDALPNRKIATTVWPLKPVGGSLFVQASDHGPVIGEANDARYAARVTAFTALDTARTVAVYRRLYPLCQQAYRELGYPDAHFNDRLVAVLDHLLAAPNPATPIAVARDDAGRWRYVDADLEAASAGQKFLMRLGPSQEAAVKAKLREFRVALAGGATPQR